MKRALLLFLFFTVAAYGGPADELGRYIEDTLDDWNVPGVAVAVVKDGKVILSKGYGITRANTEEKVDADTIFQVASVTKAFTAAALGIQVDNGKLSWDDEVIKHLPGFALSVPYSTYYATSRDLLAHRTGLPAFGGDLLGKLGYSHEQILFRLRYIPTATTFRNKAYYSNAAYFAAGELLGAIAGSTWDEAVRATILTPLKMSRSGFAENLKNKNVAYAHVLEDHYKLKVVPWDPTGGFPAAGAMTSTANDMATWMIMLLNGGDWKGAKVLKPKTIKEMFRSSMVGEISFADVAPISENSGFDYGMGWGNYHYMNRMIVEKGGGLDGARALVTLVPELNVGITVLANLNLTLYPEAIRAKFLELFVEKSDTDLEAAIKKQAAELLKILEPPKPVDHPLPANYDLDSYTGTFESTLYGSFIITRDGDELKVSAGPAGFSGKMTHYSADIFTLSWSVVNSGNEQVTYIFGPEGKAAELQTETLGNFRNTATK